MIYKKSITPKMVSNLKIFQAEPNHYLIGCLAFLQSYGIHYRILEQGVGGTFYGLLVRENFIEWQKDTLFCIHNELEPNLNIVSSIIRDNVLVVRSNITNSCRYFGDSINDGLNEAWRRNWWEQSFEFTSNGTFDFIVLLNAKHNIITVVEMLKQLHSKHLRINPAPPANENESFRLNFSFSPLLSQAMVEPIRDRRDGSLPLKFNWFPYEIN